MKANNNKRLVYVAFLILIMALGASDALRGVFAPIFKSHFSLCATDISFIITFSYVGNLIFLLIGSYLADRLNRKHVIIGTLCLWMISLMLYIVTDNYYCLLIGMLVAMGSSTLLSTMINIITPFVFVSPGLVVNTLFFVQGIGTSSSQSLVGNFATSFNSWKVVNGILLCFGFVSLLLIFFIQIPESKKDVMKSTSKESYFSFFRNKTIWYFIFIFGFYFIAEHGIMNWLMLYSQDYLKLNRSKASFYLSTFYGGITIGRLVMAPFVQRLGTLKSIKRMGGIATILYVVGLLFGNRTIILLSVSGFFFSIIYPTLVLAIQGFYKERIISTVTGIIISVATLFDICFNSIFGRLIDCYGFNNCILILPISIICFYITFHIFIMKVKPYKTI